MMESKEGIITFRAEGNNILGSIFYSRKIHYPGNINTCTGYLSGVTIGRGYDMGSRSRNDIIRDLTLAGIPLVKSKKIADAARLTGCNAMEFVKKNRDEIGEITEHQQVKLFEKIYPMYVLRAKKNYIKWVGDLKGAKKWDELSLPIRNVLVDFVYQGYTKGGRPMIAGSNNDIKELIMYIKKTPLMLSDEPARNRIGYLEKFK